MLQEDTIKLLEELKEKQYDFSGIEPLKLVHKLLPSIGVKDGVLRDEKIYPVLAHLLHDDVIENEELEKVTKLLMSEEYLYFDMENTVEYSVLKRSFTVLQLVILVYKHRTKQILDENYFQEMVTSFIKYYMEEKDFRGFEREVGWIHSVAHSADLFAQIVQCETITENTLEVILELIKDKFKRYEYMFVHDEDERSVNVIEKALERGLLKEEFMIEYVRNFGRFEKGKLYPEAYNILRNVKCFLRSMYFRFKDKEEFKYLVDEIDTVLKEVK